MPVVAGPITMLLGKLMSGLPVSLAKNWLACRFLTGRSNSSARRLRIVLDYGVSRFSNSLRIWLELTRGFVCNMRRIVVCAVAWFSGSAFYRARKSKSPDAGWHACLSYSHKFRYISLIVSNSIITDNLCTLKWRYLTFSSHFVNNIRLVMQITAKHCQKLPRNCWISFYLTRHLLHLLNFSTQICPHFLTVAYWPLLYFSSIPGDSV